MTPLLLPWIGVALIGLAILALVFGGWRRSVLAASLGTIGGLAIWVGSGEPHTVPRNLLLVAPAGGGTMRSFDNLIGQIKAKYPKMQVALLLLQTGIGANRPCVWMPARALDTAAHAGEVRLPSDGWEGRLAEAVKAAVGGRSGVTVAFDLQGLEDSQFASFKLDGALGGLVKEFNRSVGEYSLPLTTDLMAIRASETRFRQLKVEVSRSRFASHPLRNYDGEVTLSVQVPFPSGYRWAGAEGSAVLYSLVQGGALNTSAVDVVWSEAKQSHSIRFKEFTDAAQPLTPGWHYLEATLRTKEAEGSYALRGGTFIEVASRTLTVVQPPQGAGRLADDGWPSEEGTGAPPTPEQLRSSYAENESLLWREDLLSARSYLSWPDFIDSVKKQGAGKDAGVTILIEPTEANLKELDGLPAFREGLKNGEQVMIVGFGNPVTGDAPSWLPAVPATKKWATGTEIVRYNWQTRLDISLDAAAVLQGGVGHTSFQSQQAFVRHLFEALAVDKPGVPAVGLVSADILAPNWIEDQFALSRAGAGGENLVFRPPWTLFNIMSDKSARAPMAAGAAWAGDPRNTAALMIAPSHLGWRSQVLDWKGPATYAGALRPIETAVLQPRTFVMFLTANIAQPELPLTDGAKVSVGGASPVSAPVYVRPPAATASSVQTLADRRIGVDLIAVELPPDGVGALVQSVNSSGALSAPAGASLIPGLLTPSSARSLALKYSGILKKRYEIEPTLQVLQYGRVLDPRVAHGRRAPLRHLSLECPPNRTPEGFKEDTYAVVQDANSALSPIPVIVGSPYGEGFVTVLGYSPFAGDMWVPDSGAGDPKLGAGGPAPRELYPHRRDVAPKTQPQKDARGVPVRDRYDGWGIQRILDRSVLGLGASPIADIPEIEGLEWQFAESRLVAHARLNKNYPKSDEGAFSVAHLKVGTAVYPLLVRQLSLDSGLLQLSATLPSSPGPVVGEIVWNNGKVVPCVLPKVEPAVGALAHVIDQLVTVLGGDQVSQNDVSRIAERMEPRSYAGLVWILAALLVLFSPYSRPWTALAISWANFRRRARGERPYEPPPLGIAVHAEATSNDWGQSRGQAKAAVVAGIPGGERPFEPGDALQAARTSSLAFLAVPDLPAHMPTVRLKHVSMLRRAWILVDSPSRLGSPFIDHNPNKAQFAEMLMGVIAALAVPAGAELVIRWARPGKNNVELVVRTPGDLSGVQKFFASFNVDGESDLSDFIVPVELVQGDQLFLLADIRTIGFDEITRFVDCVVDDDGRLVFCALRSLSDWNHLGLVEDASTNRIFDRSEFRSDDLRRADIRHENHVTSYAVTRGAAVVPLRTDLSPSDCFRLLDQAGTGPS